jgi:hypothetical protein
LSDRSAPLISAHACAMPQALRPPKIVERGEQRTPDG